MSYCVGFEKECIVDDATNAITIQSVITSCSDLNPLSRFDPGQALLAAAEGAGGTTETAWPGYLSDDFLALVPTTQAMALLFILGTCAVAVSIVLRLSTVRYIWQPPVPQSPANGVDPPPSYPAYPGSPSSDIPPSKLQLMNFIVRVIASESYA
jgi:hypothetical protein